MVVTLIIASLIVALVSLVYTVKVGKTVNAQKNEYDTNPKISEKHPFLFNPVFLAYILGFGALLIFIFFLAMRYY
ncbi:hypothetical protein [Gracilibacillus kekensis]|uniref:Uncharacterized protein n=1 Tax=Gracilibacillus kekensis TaxID=1027249 RepID=A0A1M7QAI8_9BACI|nr:hypothetical protein [Gracilibacillus kekensis]SHN27675.1 hypothetical protein SAMN05216179_2989 [Gracilibacillus kekensis]